MDDGQSSQSYLTKVICMKITSIDSYICVFGTQLINHVGKD